MKKLSLSFLIILTIIFLMKISFCIGQERRITFDTIDQGVYGISGDRIVWGVKHEDPNSPFLSDIYLYDIGSNQTTLIKSACQFWSPPDISGDRIVWSEIHGDMLVDPLNAEIDVHFYDIAGNQEVRIYAPNWQDYPKISGDRIVWEDHRNEVGFDGNFDIYLYDISTGAETQITTDPSLQFAPSISGDKIVWTDQRHGNNDIYLYDILTGTETPITNDPDIQQDPIISGDKIVWWHDRYSIDGYDNIFLYDIITQEETQLTDELCKQWLPKISGNRVLWKNSVYCPLSGGFTLFDISTGIETHMTIESTSNIPFISGSRIVWTDYRHGNAEVYLYDLEGCEGNFDGDADQDGTDAFTFKQDFGRSVIQNPCTALEPCNGDFVCDGDVDGTDAFTFKSDFGRSTILNPCPTCVVEQWCGYE